MKKGKEKEVKVRLICNDFMINLREE